MNNTQLRMLLLETRRPIGGIDTVPRPFYEHNGFLTQNYTQLKLETIKEFEQALDKYLVLRIQNLQYEINKLEAAAQYDRYLEIDEVKALMMLRGRQRELNSMLGKIRNQNILQMIMREEEQQ